MNEVRNQPILFLRKSIENSLENNRKVGFSWQPPQNRKEVRNQRG